MPKLADLTEEEKKALIEEAFNTLEPSVGKIANTAVETEISADPSHFRIFNEAKRIAEEKDSPYAMMFEQMKEIRQQSFGKLLKDVHAAIEDDKCPHHIALGLGYWLFRQLYVFYKHSKSDAASYGKKLIPHISETEDPIPKSMYLHYADIYAIRAIAKHFFTHRFSPAKKHFLLQMFNDEQLIGDLPEKEITQHFLDWSRRTRDLKERSNLLDVMLRKFGRNPDVLKFKEEMSFGELKDHEQNVYQDQQNAHDEEIARALETVLRKIQTWALEQKECPSTIPEKVSYLKEHLPIPAEHKAVYDVLLERVQIDPTTVYGMTVLDSLVYILMKIHSSKFKEELLQRLHQEILDIDGMCSSGHTENFLNVFNGYEDDLSVNLLTFRQQLKAIITHKMSQAVLNEKQILGTYQMKYQRYYFSFLCNLVNANICEWNREYGESDVNKNLLDVMGDITRVKEVWELKNGKLHLRTGTRSDMEIPDDEIIREDDEEDGED